MDNSFLVLIPESQGKKQGGSGKPRPLHPIASDLLDEIVASDPAKVYTSRVDEAVVLNENLRHAPTLPVIERFDGVVFKALDFDSVSNKDYIFDHIRIATGLFGIIKSDSMIPNFKFTITKLGAYKRWLDENTQRVKGHFVIDLLPKAHLKSVSYDEGIRVEFFRKKNGKLRSAGHAGKHIKGRFIRWLAENNVQDVSRFSEFTEEGYHWNGKNFVNSS